MTEKRDQKKADLKTRLVDAAENRIAAQGLAALRAREVTSDAGCALGALYTAFADIDLLVLHVNSRTLARLGSALEIAAASATDPGLKLAALAQGYLAFARDNPHLWAALFDHHMPDSAQVPDWHLAEHAVLIAHIVAPLAALAPGLDEAALHLRARTLFAAVHGIVKVSLEGRFVGAREDALPGELAAFIALLTAGMAAARGA
ncbi:MAG: TetR/AcrR family transcriptional regulator [Tabrizicola sp.]|nr:TetR/AcrR family transcriptional regulator [Tabrizicola sp.]